MRLTKVSTISATPVSLADVKAHCVIQHADDDDLLAELVAEAMEQVASDTGRALLETTWRLTGERFDGDIILSKPPLIAVDSVTYIDTNGDEQTLPTANYQVISSDTGALIAPAPGTSWPAVQSGNRAAVTVNYRSGYVADDGEGGTTGTLPLRARQAVLIWAAHLYENRELMTPVALNELPSYRSLLSTLEVDLI